MVGCDGTQVTWDLDISSGGSSEAVFGQALRAAILLQISDALSSVYK